MLSWAAPALHNILGEYNVLLALLTINHMVIPDLSSLFFITPKIL